jgi:Sulfotransferase domain
MTVEASRIRGTELGEVDAPVAERHPPRKRLEVAAKSLVHAIARPTAGSRPLPDFLIVGAQRAGTTSLYRYLCAHPAVVPAVLEKGVHYFDMSPRRSVGWYRARFPTSSSRAKATREAGVPAITGEASPYYLFHPSVPARAHAVVPDARIIVMLRDPAVRAHSHHQHELERGFERLPFELAVEREALRLDMDPAAIDEDSAAAFRHQHFSYLARGRYLEQLERWYAEYPPERVHVMISEEFFAEPERAFLAVQRFLGLPEHRLDQYEIHNARSYPAMPERTRRFLVEHFAEPNDALRRRLGIHPSWSV